MARGPDMGPSTGDLDEQQLETSEWLASLDEVLDRAGGTRVAELLQALSMHAQAFGVRVPFSANTAYVNTITRAAQPAYPGDLELERRLRSRLETQFAELMINTRVTGMTPDDEGVTVAFEQSDGQTTEGRYDRVLVAAGRRPVTDGLGLEATRVTTDEHGFVKVDAQRRTEQPTIFAVGDVAGQPMLAHKATHEGRAAVEAIHGGKAVYEPRAIPAVVFTDPELAWCGYTEDEARRAGMDVTCGVFPWEASGRAATLDRSEGVTKIVAERESGRVLGVGIGGHAAGELIGEGVLAIEMGAVAEDVALTIHAHPSLSETLMEAAERVIGQSTHFFQRM